MSIEKCCENCDYFNGGVCSNDFVNNSVGGSEDFRPEPDFYCKHFNALERCPFCGGKAEVLSNVALGENYVYCSECGSSTPQCFEDIKEAIDVWNTRLGG